MCQSKIVVPCESPKVWAREDCSWEAESEPCILAEAAETGLRLLTGGCGLERLTLLLGPLLLIPKLAYQTQVLGLVDWTWVNSWKSHVPFTTLKLGKAWLLPRSVIGGLLKVLRVAKARELSLLHSSLETSVLGTFLFCVNQQEAVTTLLFWPGDSKISLQSPARVSPFSATLQ